MRDTPGRPFSIRVPAYIRQVVSYKHHTNSDGQPVNRLHTFHVSRFFSNILRHSPHILVNALVFTSVQDVVELMAEEGCVCTQSDIFYAVAKDANSCFQVDATVNGIEPCFYVVRA